MQPHPYKYLGTLTKKELCFLGIRFDCRLSLDFWIQGELARVALETLETPLDLPLEPWEVLKACYGLELVMTNQ